MAIDVPTLGFISVCVILVGALAFAAQIVQFIAPEGVKKKHIVLMTSTVKWASALTLVTIGLVHRSSPLSDEQTAYEKIVYLVVIAALYWILFFSFTDYIRRHYGRLHSYSTWVAKEGKNAEVKKNVRVDTYRSRTYIVVTKALLTILFLTLAVDIIGDNKLYQASAAFAFVVLLVGLSQSAWIPDLVNGLIVLQSEMYKEGDVVRLVDSGKTLTGEIFKIKYFNTEILNLNDNHRVTIRNSKMRDYTIFNLSRYASAFGLRQRLSFKIGYDVDSRKIRNMFRDAFDQVMLDREIDIEGDREPVFKVEDTGDHAVEWSVYYYTKQERKLLRTRQSILEIVLNTSREHDISLATPMTHLVLSPGETELA